MHCKGDRLEINGRPRTTSACRYERNSDKIFNSAFNCTRSAPKVHLLDMSWFMSWDAGEKHTEAPHYTRKMQVDREILWICFRKTHQDESFWVLQSQRAGMKIEALEPGNECYGTCQKTVGDCSFDTYLKRLWLWVDRRTSCWMRNIMLGW